tara:strand:+ start:273 stop:689 length:417 start_codon:yes stop_codon:yes gene_type:complete
MTKLSKIDRESVDTFKQEVITSGKIYKDCWLVDQYEQAKNEIKELETIVIGLSELFKESGQEKSKGTNYSLYLQSSDTTNIPIDTLRAKLKELMGQDYSTWIEANTICKTVKKAVLKKNTKSSYKKLISENTTTQPIQ